MKTAFVLTFILAVLASGCSAASPMPPKPIEKPAAAEDCPAICQRSRELGCPDGAPTTGGRTCEDVCAQGISSGLVAFDLPCMLSRDRCDLVCAGQP